MKNERFPIELSCIDMTYSTKEHDFFSSDYNIHPHSARPIIEATLKFNDGSGEIISNIDRYEYWSNRMRECSNSYNIYKSQDLDDYNYWFEYTYNRQQKSFRDDYNNSRDEIRKLKLEIINSDNIIKLKNKNLSILNNKIKNYIEKLENKENKINGINGINPFN